MKKIILIALGIILAGILIFVLRLNQFYLKIYTPIFKLIQPAKTDYNILIFGYGGGTHEGTYLTDTIMLAHIDFKLKKVTLFSIPRDLWVKIPTKSGADFHMKINALYQLELGQIGDVSQTYPDLDQSHFGKKDDAEFTKYIVSQTFGLAVDNYVAIDFAGFKKAIDTLGGVDINVDKFFEDKEYPIEGKEIDLCGKDEQFKKIESFLKPGFNPEDKIKLFKTDSSLEEFLKNATESPELAFPCRYETIKFNKGLTHMDGEMALKYARSRHSETNGGDFNRAKRQQQILEAVKDKVLSLGFVPKIIPLLDQFQNHIKTDISLDDMKKFVSQANKANEYKLNSFVFTDKNYLTDSVSEDGQYILIPEKGIDQWNGIQTAVKNIIATSSGKLKE